MRILWVFLVFAALVCSDDSGLSADGFTQDQEAAIQKNAASFQFQAEVNRLMDIIIRSLYKDRDIFIRELVSNADALDKVRYQSLTLGKIIDESELYIRVKFDKEAKTITVSDTGIGMTKDDLIKNLGIVAKSGTTEFLEAAMKGGKDGKPSINLIGQFGVGFYSVYLVADRVTVVSKHDDDKQHIWQSAADGTFTVVEDPRGNTLPRGTQVILHIKEDAVEFLDEATLERLITRYSQFIGYPISLWTKKTVTEEVSEETPTESVTEDEIEVSEEDADSKPKTKTVSKEVQDWKVLNDAKPIWTRNPKDISEDEYREFYKSFAKDYNGYLTKIHFNAEGELSFRSILFVPMQAEFNLYDKFYEKSTALKLYVRKVLISDEFEDFLPRYLNFVKGIVDSDDLPLNVSRETLAQSKVLKVMAKKITRKVLEMLKSLADKGKQKKDEEESSEDIEITTEKGADYAKFWQQYGKSIKLGVIDDRANKNKLLPLLRYVTSKSNGTAVGLDEYVERMKENQKHIYYITGESLDQVQNAPFIERLKKKDIEVVYMVDPLDEYVVQAVTEYEGNQLMSVTKGNLKLDDDESDLETLKEEYKDLASWLQKIYGKKIQKVTVGFRTLSSPAILVTGEYGWSANMERIMKAQTFADQEKYAYMMSKKTMEINPYHPIIKELKNKAAASPDDKALHDLADLLYDSALVSSGFQLSDGKDFADRINRVVALGLDVDPEAPVTEPPAQAKKSKGDEHEEALHEEL